MRHTQHHLRSAPIAIAAMLALGTTPGIAQTAQPQASQPTTAPATAPAPTPSDPIVLQSPIAPAPAPSPAAPVATPRATAPTQQPTIVLDVPPAQTADAETPAASERTTAAAATEPRRAARERTAPTPSVQRDAAPVAAAPTVAPDTPVASDDGAAIVADEALAPPVAEAAPEALPAEAAPATGPDWVAIISLALAGLIPLGAIFLALAWFRRRSRRVDAVEQHEEVVYVDEPAIAPEPLPAAATPVVEEPAPQPTAHAPAFAATPAPIAAAAPQRRHPLDGYKGMPNEGAAVSLPAEMPETFEERDALLKKMIAAEPDRANPFRSTKARAKRARLIMQSLGRTFENVKPRFDLSQYTRNWPALAGHRHSFA